ncbi:MAG: sigma-70 family RNA polymerase sigma factor [Candidatus Eisenbacteria bacterium]|nr:sigma-70 family RNA polymerase sigma factor [Candidatus Eisenbacteria bacterium]
MLSARDDAARVRRSLEGDPRAFEELVEAYQKVLFNLALRMVRNREDAHDLTQSVFIKAYRSLHRYDDRHKFFSWIYRIMIHESINLLHRRRPHEPLDERIVQPGACPAERWERDEMNGRVREAVTRLSEDHRDVIVLRHFLQLSHREMSELLRVPEKTVKSRLHTARQRLGEILARTGVVR